METACYSFRMEWLDPFAELRRPYKLKFHERMDKKHKIELFDLRTKKTFLKPTEYPSIQLDDLFIGARVNIFGRQMTVLDYDDAFTRNHLEQKQQRCLAILGYSTITHLGDIWSIINQSGLKIVHLRMCSLSDRDVHKLFENPDKELLNEPILVMELVGENAVQLWHDTIPSLKESEMQGVIREAGSPQEAERVLETCFGHGHKGHAPDMAPPVTAFGGTGPGSTAKESHAVDASSAVTPTALMDDKSSCAVVLPHVILSKDAGPLISDFMDAIESTKGADGGPLRVTAMQMFELDLVTAEEFLEVYKHVAPEFRVSTWSFPDANVAILALLIWLAAGHGSRVEFRSMPCYRSTWE
eukprot:gb/GECG01004269.1/.p1 GENE.gb/GECG01004269.1/~~gb/GECG01004269.1/.p1  ORF type:complete len:356 (+),score=38.77 gb/GECG01004269.1/:1-1068(+)